MTRLLSKPLVATALLSGPQRRHSHHRLLGFCAWWRGDAIGVIYRHRDSVAKAVVGTGFGFGDLVTLLIPGRRRF